MPSSELVNPWSAHLSLAETIGRLQDNDGVVALCYLGSTGTDRWTEASDFDLLLLVNDYPSGYGTEATIVDGRITDVVIVSCHNAARVGTASSQRSPAQPEASEVEEGEWPYVRWLAEARPVYDPTGAAAAARGRAAVLVRHRPPPVEAQLQVIRAFLSHDLRVNAALLRRCDDRTIRAALGMRQLHTFVSGVQAWFSMRGLPNEGWKKNMGRLARDEPETFSLVEEWLATSDVEARHVIFERVLLQVLADVGGPHPEGTVLADAQALWDSLRG